MKTKTGFYVVGAILGMTLQSMTAHAVYLGVRGGITRHNVSLVTTPTPTVTTTTTAHSGWLIGGFGGLDIMATPLSIEGGASLEQRKWDATAAGSTKVLTTRNLLLEGLARFSLPFVSLGAGLYGALALPGVDTEINGVKQLSHSHGAEGLEYGDFGFLGSVRFRIPLALMGVSVDGRYLHGLEDMSAVPGTVIKTREFQFLAGLDFGI